MINCKRLILLGCLFFFWSKMSKAQPLTAKGILEQSLVASGGISNYEQNRSSLQSYDLIQSNKIIASILILRDRGNRYLRSIIALNYTPSTRIFNGEQFWQQYGADIISISENEVPDHILLKTYLTPEEGYWFENFELQRLDDEHIGDETFYTLLADNGKGYGTINYFDQNNGQLSMIVYQGNNRAILAQREAYEGIQLPTAIINKEEDGSANVLQLKHHFSNYTIDEDIFQLQFADSNTPFTDEVRFGTFRHKDGRKMIRSENNLTIIDKNDTTSYVANWKFKNTYSIINVNRLKSAEPITSKDIILMKIINFNSKSQFLHIHEKGESRIEKWIIE